MSILPANPAPGLALALDAGRQDPPLEWPARFIAAVVAILTHEASGRLKVEEMPDKPERYDIGQYDGALLVHYRGSKYRKVSGGSSVLMQRDFEFDVHCVMRGVRGRDGAPNVMERVRIILQNRQIEGCLPLEPQDDGLVQQGGGVWDYAVSFRGGVPAVGAIHPRHRGV